MAPKGAYKVHSLSKHIEAAKQGLAAEAHHNKHSTVKAVAGRKKKESVFNNHSDEDEESESDSSDESSDEEGAGLLQKITAQANKAKKLIRNEEIADSDDERRKANDSTARTQEKKQFKREETSDDSGGEAETESGSESKSVSGLSEAKVKANGAAPHDATTPSAGKSSASQSNDNESESDGSGDVTDKKTARVQSSDSGSASDDSSSSDSGSESDGESDSDAKQAPTTAKRPVNGVASKRASTDDSSDEEDSDDSKEEGVASKGKGISSSPSHSVDDSMHIADRAQEGQVAIPDFIAPDFVLRKSDENTNGQDVARLCNQANMQGKQVWYFTVPANVPISVVQKMEIPMDHSNRGDRVFSHDGDDYGISFDSMMPKSSISILIPSADGARYSSGRAKSDSSATT